MERVLTRALETVATAVNAHEGVILLIDPLTDRMVPRAALHADIAALSSGETEHPAGMLAHWLLDNNNLLIANNLQQESYWDKSVAGGGEWQSALAVLLESNDDPQGVLVLLNHET